MKKVTLNAKSEKKLQLKKTVVSHLQMNEGQMRMIVGGEDGSRADVPPGGTPCTSKFTSKGNYTI